MKYLIRPGFFALARASISLIVILWAFGQFCYFSLTLEAPARTWLIQNHVDSFQIRAFPEDRWWPSELQPYARERPPGLFEVFETLPQKNNRGCVTGPVPGTITVLDYQDEPMGVIVSYWWPFLVFVALQLSLTVYYGINDRRSKLTFEVSRST